MSKTRILALMGKSGTGKDTLQNHILSRDNEGIFKKIVSCTTRPIRDYEVDGVDYHFITKTELYKKILENSFLEVSEFNSWFYGTLLEDLDADKVNVGVFNPKGVMNLLELKDIYNLDILPILLTASDKIRLLRALEREENPNIKEIIRRYKADEKDFENFSEELKSITIELTGTDTTEYNRLMILNYCEVFFD